MIKRSDLKFHKYYLVMHKCDGGYTDFNVWRGDTLYKTPNKRETILKEYDRAKAPVAKDLEKLEALYNDRFK